MGIYFDITSLSELSNGLLGNTACDVNVWFRHLKNPNKKSAKRKSFALYKTAKK